MTYQVKSSDSYRAFQMPNFWTKEEEQAMFEKVFEILGYGHYSSQRVIDGKIMFIYRTDCDRVDAMTAKQKAALLCIGWDGKIYNHENKEKELRFFEKLA